MEINDSRRRSGSFRINSSSLWTNATDAFAKSSRQEDDEAALKWAALQSVPTFDRLKKGLMTGLRGETFEVDINNIGYEEKKKILERLIKVAERDNETFLLKLKDRMERYDRHPFLLWKLETDNEVKDKEYILPYIHVFNTFSSFKTIS